MKIKEIELDPKEIVFDPNQPRKVDMENEKTKELIENQAKTYKTQGIINEPEVRKKDGKFMCVTGELRIRSAIKASLPRLKLKQLIGLSEKDVRERQLIENIHLHKLETDEAENAIADLYYKYYKENDNGAKKGSQAKIAKILGLNPSQITHALKSYKTKKKYNLEDLNISTISGYLLSTLPERDQKRIVNQLQKGVISKDLQSYIPKLKNLSEDVKNATLRVNDPIDIKDAEFIEKFKEPEEKKEIINWLQRTKKSMKDTMELRLKISEGEEPPEISIELDPQEKIIENMRTFIINGINRINLPYLREELKPAQFDTIISLTKRLQEHINYQFEKVGISKRLKVIDVDG